MEWFTLIIIIIASLGIGYFSAIMIGNSRKEEVPDVPLPPSVPAVQDELEVFRLLKQSDGSGVLTEIHGRKIKMAKDLNEQEHAEISMGLVDLYAWLELANRPALSSEAEATAKEFTEDLGTGRVNVNSYESVIPETTEGFKGPSLNIFKSLRKTTQSEVKEKIAPPPDSIAIQVDEILQAKLEEKKVDEKAVRLLDLPNQGMVIMVGLEKYTDLEDVPDEELRGILRESVAEWESRMLGGD